MVHLTLTKIWALYLRAAACDIQNWSAIHISQGHCRFTLTILPIAGIFPCKIGKLAPRRIG
eukprot:scaffold164065_cov14-Tisochrysis_lutea.AAC.1